MELKTILNYNKSSYFNNTNHFLFYIPSLKKYIISKVELYNGSWYTTLSLNFKATSIPSINADVDLKGVEVLYRGTILQGIIGDTAVDGNLKIWWKNNQSATFKKIFPHVWNEPKNIIINPRKEVVTHKLKRKSLTEDQLEVLEKVLLEMNI